MFSKSTKNDPHIKKIIAHISKETGVAESALFDEIDKEMAKIAGLEKKSPILYETIAENYVESKAFNLLKEHAVKVDGAPKFNTVLFFKLFRRLRAENNSLFPLRNFIDSKALEPRIIFVPDAKGRATEFEGVDTACATPDGEFVFNTEFMQYLLNFAHLKGLKPKGKKYSSNGGDIPDEYSYIEFLIKHELYHYTYADFHYKKILKGDNQIINWVGDFRSNHDLVKSGHDQLPIGLYSNHVNYNKQNTYEEMYDLVKSEMDKLEPPEIKQLKKMMSEMSDEHTEPQDSDDDGEGSPQDGEGDGKNKKKKPVTKKSNDKANSKSKDDIEENEKRAREKTKAGKELGKEDDSPAGKDGKAPVSKGSGGKPGTGTGGNHAVDYTKFKPRFSWKALLKKLIQTGDEDIETTYQRPHRRNVTNTHIIAQTGAGAIKPAEMMNPKNSVKLLIVEDSSGSMSDKIELIYAEIASLIKASSRDIASFAMIKFSGSHTCYLCSFKNGKGVYWKLDSFKNMKPDGDPKPFHDLLKVHFAGGTEFKNSVITDIKHGIKEGYNILVVSDDDMCIGENLTNFKELYSAHKKQVFIMMKDHDCYSRLCKAMSEVSQNFTHL
jgi:predicted metal-dependent peptidase